MRYCWSHEDDKPHMITPAWFSVGIACAGGFLYLGYYRFLTPMICLILFPLMVCAFFVSFITARRYLLDSSGILIQYPFHIRHHIPWEQFSEISLCKIHYASASDKHVCAIRCVIGAEKHGPKQACVANESWSTPEYEILHCRHIFSIFYTPDRIADFHRFCPYPLADYRHLKDRP